MIRLEVGTYCHNCPEFSPEAIFPAKAIYYLGQATYETDTDGDTVVCCRNADLCKRLRNHIHREMLKEKV